MSLKSCNPELAMDGEDTDSLDQNTECPSEGGTQFEVVDDISEDEEEEVPMFKQRTYKELCCSFAENNSFHGIPYISKAGNWYSRSFWTFAFLFFIAAWIYHSYFLIHLYLKYESTNSLNINYEALEYPSVTICNVNPIRTSKLNYYGSQELNTFIASIRPSFDYTMQLPGANSGGEGQGTGQGEQGQQGQEPPPGRKKRQTERGAVAEEEQTREGLGAVTDAAFGEGNASATLQNYNEFKRLYTAVPRENRTAMGHEKDTFILLCSFNGRECTTDDFVLYENSDYGNCYMFNSEKNRSDPLRSARSGITFGLDLILFIENDEYMMGMPYGTGVRFYVHPFRTLPDVAQTGISAPPGVQTLIGFTMNKMKKLDGKFGKCGDNGTFQRYYKLKYTQQACTRTCLDRTIAHNCACVRMDHFDNYNADDLEDLPSCYDNMDSEICAGNLEILNDLNKVACGCDPACKSTDYEYLTTESVWPDVSYWYKLVDLVCNVNDDHCTSLRATGSTALSNNFLNLKLYYRDLNYKDYQQQALYEDAPFISDMGGCIGLWVGASAITVVELVDFLFKCCHFATWRNQEKTKHREKLRAQKFREVAQQ